MYRIEIDDYTFGYLTAISQSNGQQITDLIRGLVDITYADTVRSEKNTSERSDESEPSNELETVLKDFLKAGYPRRKARVVDRFLALLSCVCRLNEKNFEHVLQISGRSRKYFALSEAELLASGNSVNPKKIPETKYWVVTNNDTPTKLEIILNVLNETGWKDSISNSYNLIENYLKNE
jgi:negative modulator of initiation of replication